MLVVVVVMVYSLLDRKVREFGQLLLAANEETMRRTVFDVISGSGSMIEKYPRDFDLFHVGEFDQDSGVICGDTPTLVDNVASILEVGNGS